MLLLGYSYPAVAQFLFTLFINELLLCLAETLPICCCCIVVVAIVVIYYTLSICCFAMLIALRLNAFTFCLRGSVLKCSPNFDTRNNGTKRGPHQSVKCVLIWPRSGKEEGGVRGVWLWMLRYGVCLN